MKSLWKLLLICGCLAFFCLLPARSVYAEARQVYTGTIGLQQTDWSGSMSFPRFNPSIGILKGVEFALGGQLQGRAEFESLDAQASTVTVAMSANVQLQRPNGSQILKAVPNASVAAPVEPFDHEIDFGGPSGHVFPKLIGIDIVESGAFSDPSDLALFTGVEGFIGLPVTAKGTASGQGGGNLALNYVTSVSAVVTVTYLYDNSSIDLEKFTNGDDADDAPGVLLSPGDPVTWTYIITNTGGVDLVEVNVMDDQEGAINCPATSLAAGASMTCTLVSANGAQPIQYTNVATVTAKTPDDGVNPRRTVTDSDPSNYSAAQIDLEKFTNGDDADNAPGVLLSPGDPVTWTYIITNTSGIDLVEVNVVDDQEGAISCPATSLAAGASMSCTLVSADGAQPIQYTNVATVTAKTPDDGVHPRRTVTDSDPSNYSAAQIDLEKFTNGDDADDAPGVLLSPGDPVTWTYIITNTSGIDLVEVNVMDDQEGAINRPATSLAAGASMTCTLVSADGAQPIQYTNVATVTAKTPDDGVNPRRTVTDSDPSNYTASELALCPMDNQGRVKLPTIVYMGTGPRTFILPDGFDSFIIKRRATVGLPFKFDTEPGVPTGDGHRALVVDPGTMASRTRVWACAGDCMFVAHLDGAVDMGHLQKGLTVGAVVIDDDVDDRINRWVADDNSVITEFLIEEQTMVEYLQLVVPKTANWSYFAVDSVGIVDLCLVPPNSIWPMAQSANGRALPDAEENADTRVLLPAVYGNRQ